MASKAKKIAVKTTDYEQVHGRKPRGTAHWTFSVRVPFADGTMPVGTIHWHFYGPFSLARSACEARARVYGAVAATVLA